MRQRGHFGRICLILAAVLIAMPATASRLDGALDALESEPIDEILERRYQRLRKLGSSFAEVSGFSVAEVGPPRPTTTDNAAAPARG